MKPTAKDTNGRAIQSLYPPLIWLADVLLIPLIVILYLIGINNFTLAYLVSLVIVTNVLLFSLLREVKDRRCLTRERIDRLEQQTFALAVFLHQLRQPLVSAKSYARILVETPSLPEASAGYAVALAKELDHLDKLAKEMTDFAAVSRNSLSLRKTTVQLEEIIAECLKRCQPEAESREVKLDWTSQQPLPLMILDKVRLSDILDTLLNNAIGHTPSPGAVKIEVKLNAQDLEVWVTDQGPGILPADQDSVFEPFYQAAGGGGKPAGLGLGLTLARKIVEIHGGRIGVTNAPGRGASFFFKLPLHLAVADNTKEVQQT